MCATYTWARPGMPLLLYPLGNENDLEGGHRANQGHRITLSLHPLKASDIAMHDNSNQGMQFMMMVLHSQHTTGAREDTTSGVECDWQKSRRRSALRVHEGRHPNIVFVLRRQLEPDRLSQLNQIDQFGLMATVKASFTLRGSSSGCEMELGCACAIWKGPGLGLLREVRNIPGMFCFVDIELWLGIGCKKVYIIEWKYIL